MFKLLIATVLLGSALSAPKDNSINFRPQLYSEEHRKDDSNILMEFIQSAIARGAIEMYPQDDADSEGSCRPHRAMIDFRKIKGANWILSPTKVDIGVCSGSCSNNKNLTAYDFFANSFAPSIPNKKCIVSKYGDLSFLYVDEFGNLRSVVLRKSVAIRCACAR